MGVSPFALYDCVVDDLVSSRLLASHDVEAYRAECVGSINGFGLPDQQFAALHLLKALVAKLEPPRGGEADRAAIEKFLSVNDLCSAFTLDLDQELRVVFGYARAHLARWFEPGANLTLSQAAISDHARFGPGSSAGSAGTSFYEKVYGPLCASSDFLGHWYMSDMLASEPTAACENSRQSAYGPVSVRKHGSLETVPKKRDISRTICIEPAVNTYFQLGAAELLTEALRRSTGIDIPTQQERNRMLASTASVTGEYFTLDLSSASDSISMELVRHLWPRSTAGWLRTLRTPQCSLPDGRIIDLHMLGTMGNGTTFVVQTATFCALLWGVYDHLGIKRVNPVFDRPGSHANRVGNFGVYGDDCIGASSALPLFARILKACGFKVNVDKTFCGVGFNESCGGDYYHGRDVRGVYIRKDLSELSENFKAFNRLADWSARHGVPLYRALTMLRDAVRGWKMHLVPPGDDLETGFHCPPPKPVGPYRVILRRERRRCIDAVDLHLRKRWSDSAFAIAYLSGCFVPYKDRVLKGVELSGGLLMTRRSRGEQRRFDQYAIKTAVWPTSEIIRRYAPDVADRWNRQLSWLTTD